MNLIGVDITKLYDDVTGASFTSTTDKGFTKGTRFTDEQGREYIFLAGVASCAAGSWVSYNQDDHSTVLLVADAVGPVGVAVGACTASYAGWFQIYGKCSSAKCLTQFADNGYVFATSTDGSVDDTSVAGDLVERARGASTTVVDSGVAEFELHYPYVNNRTNK